MLQISLFFLFLLSTYCCYRCFTFVIIAIDLCLLSFHDPDSFLLLLSTIDNDYADFDYV